MQITKWTLYVLLLAGIFIGGLFTVDRLVSKNVATRGTIGDMEGSGGIDPANPRVTVNTFDFYPWTGGHTQANASLYDGNFRTGDHGFFVDFDLERPPPKKNGELRILWTGGSSAAGWGARANYSMIYKVLEQYFAATNPCGPNYSLRVVNLAMGDSKSYQNFISLNLWGHALEPDMIVSFSGFNDMSLFFLEPQNVWSGYFQVRGMTLQRRNDAGPEYIKFLANLFPGLMRNSILGNLLRGFNEEYLQKEAIARYAKNFPPQPSNPSEVLDRVVIPAYAHALSSIKRDFPDIPMAVILQPYMATEATPKASGAIRGMTRDKFALLYERFFNESIKRLRKITPENWVFYNSHQWFRENMDDLNWDGDGIHMQDEVQQAVARELAKSIFPVLCRVASRRKSL